jgi:hypothetical protein
VAVLRFPRASGETLEWALWMLPVVYCMHGLAAQDTRWAPMSGEPRTFQSFLKALYKAKGQG